MNYELRIMNYLNHRKHILRLLGKHGGTVSNEEIAFAVESLIAMEGGMVVVRSGEVLASMPLPIAGLMTSESGEWVEARLAELHEKVRRELGVSEGVEPVMALTFMALPVIPALKLTDRGLFDFESFGFLPLEAP